MKTLAQTFAPSFALFALLVAGLPLTASAGNKTATSAMQVSFVVKEACTVQTATGPASVQQRGATTATAPAPVVACELKTPYLLTRGADQPAAAAIDRAAAPIRTESGAQNWVVYF
ncbi:hypothetical protein SAMN05428959_10969 [Duganella sp. CF517]|uniref:hypothetical protein n=1 Tax=Duganella sp. CF517 TaxID=1881038 RepID=UPI0008B6C277|nr:hypothetical protein [Duganella sp. CF517]SEO51806.1 hypothetical protein SAMN05428959_10969 [Duganella sp. CF517]